MSVIPDRIDMEEGASDPLLSDTTVHGSSDHLVTDLDTNVQSALTPLFEPISPHWSPDSPVHPLLDSQRPSPILASPILVQSPQFSPHRIEDVSNTGNPIQFEGESEKLFD